VSQDGDQHRVLEHIRVIAGVEGVAVAEHPAMVTAHPALLAARLALSA
jgi:hypothetical protein